MEDIIFTPFDLPKLKFDREKLLPWFDSTKARGYEEYVAPINYPWNVLWLRDEDRGVEWHPEIETYFPNLFQIDLPFEVMRKVYILEQLIDVMPHRDVSREDRASLGPSTYRAMLINEKPDSFYYLRGGVKSDADKPIHPTFPEPGMWFGHNNYNSRHGSFCPDENQRKLIFCVWGNVDEQRHRALVERSAEKFQEYVIR